MDSGLYSLWGEEKQEYHMNQKLLNYIRDKVGLKEDRVIWNGYYKVDEIPGSSELKQILTSCISEVNISFDSRDRLRHSIGRSGGDYIRLLEGSIDRIVDAVVYPTEDEIKCLLQKRHKELEIIPFGGGTTVTGGVIPSGTRRFTVSLDLARLDTIVVDEINNILVVGAGVKGPKIEEELSKHGLTLGNFPESFLYSTIGGWIATNAAGQESNRYGKLKEMVLGLRMESSRGTFQDRIVPGESAFFRLADVAVGSEGAFGVVTRAWLKVHRKPEKLYYSSYIFKSFDTGIEALREKFTEEKMPMISRLSDEDETDLSMMGVDESFMTNIFKKYVGFRTHNVPGALLIAVSDNKYETAFDGGISLSSIPAKIWERDRYSRPLMYNELLKRGIVAETIETSSEWSKLNEIHRSTRKKFQETMEEMNVKGIILCHSSHQYVTGSALYFTFLFYSDKDRGPILEKVREAILDNIISKGGSISHHHGIGTIQSKYMGNYKGNLYEVIKKMKSEFDPDGNLVPGILEQK
jgi:alkyldihydroxyacetonephosphate synthase